MPQFGVRRAGLPQISTASHLIPTATSIPLFSFAVPPIVESPASFDVESPAMSLLANRTTYRVSENEAPIYAVTNSEPEQPIHWTLSRNGVTLIRDQVFDAATDSRGQWTGQGSPWTREQNGHWEVVARTGERRATARLLVQTVAPAPATQPVAGILGVSHVAGGYRFATPGSNLAPETFLVEGAKHVRNVGARHVFVHLSPQYRIEYPFDDFGPGELTSLRQLASTPQFQKLLQLPFETVILSTYSFANWDWLLTRGQAERAPLDVEGEESEMSELVRHLLATYPGKRFVIKNWEGDWQLKQSFQPDAVATNDQVSEFIDFLRARQRGVKAGRAGDERAEFAIEFNLVHLAQRGQRCMLLSVIPQVESDLLAYSSWWTLGKSGDLARNIADDLAFVRSLPGLGGRPVIVTEFGFEGKQAQRGEQARIAAQAFAEAGVPLAIYWQVFDNLEDIGLVGKTAQRLPAWHALRTLAGAKNDAEFLPELSQVPSEVPAGSETPVRVVIRNRGTLFDPVIGYALGVFDADSRLRQTVWIQEEVPKDGTVELSFSLRAPRVPGPCTLRCFQHGVELFGDELTINVAV